MTPSHILSSLISIGTIFIKIAGKFSLQFADLHLPVTHLYGFIKIASVSSVLCFARQWVDDIAFVERFYHLHIEQFRKG